jgi:3-oxoacyl-[acyl-carrier-protein] synthase-3
MYVPPRVVTNDAIARVLDTSDEWIQVRTGIKERRYAEAGQASSDMALPAVRDAITDAGLEPDDIDYVVFATMTPDYYFPGSAPFLQRKLGLPKVPHLDIRQQCAGFIYGLQLAHAFVRSQQYRRILVVGAEVHTCLIPWNQLSWDVVYGDAEGPVPKEDYDRNTETRDRCVLFGDGAGAMVIEACEDEDRGIIDCLIHTDGSEAERLWIPAGGSAFRPYFQPKMFESGDVTPIVDGRKVYALAVTAMPEVTLEILGRNKLTLDDVDLFVMHQANLRINEGVQKRLGLPDEKVFNNIQHYANTTAATIPMAYHEALRAGRIKKGDLVCFVGLGSGLNWGAVLYRS